MLIFRIKISRKIFAYLFSVLGPILKSKKIIDSNIKTFSKNISDKDRKKIKVNMWKNYGMTFAEYMFLPYLRKQNNHILVKGENNLPLISDDRPVIFVSGHFANFELMSMEITKRKIKLATIYRPLNNIFLNPLMEYLRKKYICKNQIKKGRSSVRDLLTLYKNGSSIALMIDQRVSEGLKLDFFQDEAYTTTIPAQFVKKFNCKVVPIHIEREKEVNFRLTIFKPLKFNEDDSLKKITQELNFWLENTIKSNPKKWIWSHDRWK
jgi:KDO2-lipid IV(A) lauroyltransferase